MITCDKVAYQVQTDSTRRYLVHPVSFKASAGKITLLRGPSGAGKSTLMAMVAGVLRPTEGQVLFGTEPVSRYTAAHRDRFRRHVGYVPQRLFLFDELTPLENVLLPAAPRRHSNFVNRATKLLDQLEVPTMQQVRTLSGGEQQRVAVARALLTQPPVLVLDEPTAHQDIKRVDVIVNLVRASLEHDTTVLVAAHDPRLDPRLKPDVVLTFDQGALVTDDTATT